MLGKSPTEMIFKRHEVQVAHTQRKNMGAGSELAFSPFSSMNTNLFLLGVKRKFSFGQIIYHLSTLVISSLIQVTIRDRIHHISRISESFW